jgi:hypothetical protein
MIECNPLQEWARSSMAEQRPFKPFVEGSIPSALTKNPPIGGFLFAAFLLISLHMDNTNDGAFYP